MEVPAIIIFVSGDNCYVVHRGYYHLCGADGRDNEYERQDKRHTIIFLWRQAGSINLPKQTPLTHPSIHKFYQRDMNSSSILA